MLKYYVVTLMFLAFYKIYGTKTGFDQLETAWLFMALSVLVLSWQFKGNDRIKFIAVAMATSKTLRGAIVFVMMLVASVAGGRYTAFELSGRLIYHNALTMKRNLDQLPHHGTIVMSNYPSNHIEYYAHTLFGRNKLVIHGKAIRVLQFVMGKDHMIGVAKGSFDRIQKSVKETLESGHNIFCYVERDYYNRSEKWDLCELRSGMFRIAKNLGVTITPVVIDHIEHSMGVVADQPFIVQVDRTRYVKDVELEMKKTREFMLSTLRRIRYDKTVKRIE